jgi:succinate dehydrogenase / fumarate reductase cytochrome b subunit
MVLAASGFVMLGFVVLHMGGNLLAFAGGATFNAYARSLRELGSPLIGSGVLLTLCRVVLTGALVAHVAAHLWIFVRPPKRPSYDPAPPSYAAFPLPIMIPSGGASFLFVALHLAQLTFGATVPAFDPADPYRNLITTLRSWPVALAYLAAAAAVSVHLLVGVWSGMKSLRLIRPRTEGLARLVAPAVALVIALGLASVPAAVLLGVLS